MNNYNDDYNIIKECLDGDREAYSQLIDRYKNYIFNFVFRMTGNYHNAEDITMQTFIQAFKKLKDFKISYKFVTWIYTIAANITKDSLRRQNIVKIFSLGFKKEDDDDDSNYEMPDGEKGPEDKYYDTEVKNMVKKIIDLLPGKYREIFILRYIENLSYTDISQITGLPLGTIENRLFRAKKLLLNNNEIVQETKDLLGG